MQAVFDGGNFPLLHLTLVGQLRGLKLQAPEGAFPRSSSSRHCLSVEISPRALGGTPACGLSTWLDGGYVPRFRVPTERKPSGESNLRSHVVSVTQPHDFGCGSHRVLPGLKGRECTWHGHIGVAIFWKYFYNLAFIKHLELSVWEKCFAGTNPIAIRVGTSWTIGLTTTTTKTLQRIKFCQQTNSHVRERQPRKEGKSLSKLILALCPLHSKNLQRWEFPKHM